MKVCYLGTGSWGFCLANLLASKGYEITSWTTKESLAKELNETGNHPLYPSITANKKIFFTSSIKEALSGAEFLVESVTTGGIRPVFEEVKKHLTPNFPIVITSKGVELNTGKLIPEVLCEIFGDACKPFIGIISGPSFAGEIIRGLPTSIVGTAYDEKTMQTICKAFTTDTLRVYPNSDIKGVALVSALKNAVAIACGMSDGLKMGNSARAALMTRGLHEIRKLGVAMGCRPETFSGLAGMGDLCMTCSSPLSRNYRFGVMIAEGMTAKEAREKIGVIVEGSYSCEAALRLSKEFNISIPITEGVYEIIHDRINLSDALPLLMKRSVKEEHL